MNSIPSRLTYCNLDGELLRIWGIVDCKRSQKIDRVLDSNADRLAHACPPIISPSELANGTLILVKYGTHYPLFKRATIVNNQLCPWTSRLHVYFVDVGKFDTVSKEDIRLLSAFPDLKELDGPPCAQDFILSDALVSFIMWSPKDLLHVNLILSLHHEVKFVDEVAGKTLISFSIGAPSTPPVSFHTYLVENRLAGVAPLPVVKAAVMRRHGSPSTIPQPPQPEIPHLGLYGPFSPYRVGPSMISSPLNDWRCRPSPGWGGYLGSPPAVFPQPGTLPQQLQVLANTPIIHAFRPLKLEPLLVGSYHEVYVSHVIHGAQSFMIQLKENMDSGRLQRLINQLNDPSIHHEPIELCHAGLICMGRYSADEKLYRAVVSKVLTGGAELLFVDYGNTETVPFSEIYKLPVRFFEEPIMALQFTLARLSTNSALLTKRARHIFEELAEDPIPLLLRVSKPEIQGKQYCELYFYDDEKGVQINVRQKIIDEVEIAKPVLYERLTLQKNSTNNVSVRCVETPIKFFVQLKANEQLLDSLMNSLDEYCAHSPMKSISSIEKVHDNMAVWFKSRLQWNWGRGLVVGKPMEDGYVNIFDVDSGYTQDIHFSELRIMNNGRFTKLPKQAIECRLNIDKDFALREEVVTAFNNMAYVNLNKMKVIDILPENALLVDMFDEEDHNAKDVLLSKFSVVKPTSLASNPPESAASQKAGPLAGLTNNVERKCCRNRKSREAEINIEQQVHDKMDVKKRVEYKKLSFEVNSTHDVSVTNVETPIRFFVQVYGEGSRSCTVIDSFKEYVRRSPAKNTLSIEEVHDRMAVWYSFPPLPELRRGLVVGEPLNDGYVDVFDVDMGYTEKIHFRDLRIMDNEVITSVPMQAIECRLDINSDFALRKEVITAFEYVVYMWARKMKVINVLPENVLLVDLFDKGGQNVKDVLLSIFVEVEPISPLACNPPESGASQKSGVENKNGHILDNQGAEINIEQKMHNKMEVMTPVEYKKLTLKKNSSNEVLITHIESPLKFFVSLKANERLLETLMDSIEEYCLHSPMKSITRIDEVHNNMAVWFMPRFECEWQRGLVVAEPLEDGFVDVFDVDSGVTETVHFSRLRVMNNGLFTRLPRQAVECRLDMDADLALGEEVVKAFKDMVEDDTYKMKVINVLPEDVLLVNLFDEEGRSVTDMLPIAFDVEKPSSPPANNAHKSGNQ